MEFFRVYENGARLADPMNQLIGEQIDILMIVIAFLPLSLLFNESGGGLDRWWMGRLMDGKQGIKTKFGTKTYTPQS